MGMKLVQLNVSGFKRITVAEVEFDTDASGVVVLKGRNGAGKSSFLDAFAALVTPGRNIPKRSMPVHAGEDEALIVGEFADDDGRIFKVTRRYVAETGKTSILVQQDGLKVADTSTITSAIYSHIALDPLAFATLDPAKQVQTLVQLIGFDPKPLDEKRANLYATRTDIGREVDRLKGVVKSAVKIDRKLAAASPVDPAAIALDLDAMRSRNRQRIALSSRATETEETIASLEQRLEGLRAYRAEIDADLEELGAEESEADLVAKLSGAQATNDAIRAQRDRAASVKALEDEEARYKNMTGLIEEVDREKLARLAEAKMPVEGLSIEGDEVLLDGTPFAEAASGIKLRTSTAIAIALNPNLRAIIIRDGSLLDADNRKVIDEIAREHDFLVLMEVVDENAPGGILFEDGEATDLRDEVTA